MNNKYSCVCDEILLSSAWKLGTRKLGSLPEVVAAGDKGLLF